MHKFLTFSFSLAPPKVDRPEIHAIRKGKIMLHLRRASGRNGPISHYHLIVVPVRRNKLKMPRDYTFDEVKEQNATHLLNVKVISNACFFLVCMSFSASISAFPCVCLHLSLAHTLPSSTIFSLPLTLNFALERCNISSKMKS